MKPIITTLLFFGVFIFGIWFSRIALPDKIAERHIEAQQRYILELETCIRSIGEIQQQLIDAGYEWVIVDGNEVQLTVDYLWGPKTEKAYCNYKAREAMARTAGEKE